jgi:hypothetical protein
MCGYIIAADVRQALALAQAPRDALDRWRERRARAGSADVFVPSFTAGDADTAAAAADAAEAGGGGRAGGKGGGAPFGGFAGGLPHNRSTHSIAEEGNGHEDGAAGGETSPLPPPDWGRASSLVRRGESPSLSTRSMPVTAGARPGSFLSFDTPERQPSGDGAAPPGRITGDTAFGGDAGDAVIEVVASVGPPPDGGGAAGGGGAGGLPPRPPLAFSVSQGARAGEGTPFARPPELSALFSGAGLPQPSGLSRRATDLATHSMPLTAAVHAPVAPPPPPFPARAASRMRIRPVTTASRANPSLGRLSIELDPVGGATSPGAAPVPAGGAHLGGGGRAPWQGAGGGGGSSGGGGWSGGGAMPFRTSGGGGGVRMGGLSAAMSYALPGHLLRSASRQGRDMAEAFIEQRYHCRGPDEALVTGGAGQARDCLACGGAQRQQWQRLAAAPPAGACR